MPYTKKVPVGENYEHTTCITTTKYFSPTYKQEYKTH